MQLAWHLFFQGVIAGVNIFFDLYFSQFFHGNKRDSSINMYKAAKSQGGQQGSYPAGIAKVVIGATLLGIGEFLGSGSATLFGSDQAAGGLGELGL